MIKRRTKRNFGRQKPSRKSEGRFLFCKSGARNPDRLDFVIACGFAVLISYFSPGQLFRFCTKGQKPNKIKTGSTRWTRTVGDEAENDGDLCGTSACAEVENDGDLCGMVVSVRLRWEFGEEEAIRVASRLGKFRSREKVMRWSGCVLPGLSAFLSLSVVEWIRRLMLRVRPRVAHTCGGYGESPHTHGCPTTVEFGYRIRDCFFFFFKKKITSR